MVRNVFLIALAVCAAVVLLLVLSANAFTSQRRAVDDGQRELRRTVEAVRDGTYQPPVRVRIVK